MPSTNLYDALGSALRAMNLALENKYAGDAEPEMGACTLRVTERLVEVTLAVAAYCAECPESDPDFRFEDAMASRCYFEQADAEGVLEWVFEEAVE